jgi:hypothetical protein
MSKEALQQVCARQQGLIDQPEFLNRVPVSRKTEYNWRIAGKIPFIKIGKRVLYHWPSVEAALLRMQRNVADQ